MRIAIAGSAISGTAAAIVLARRGHDVILVERDAAGPPIDPRVVFDDWQRPGVAHFRLPHNFLALGRALLAQHLPDVLDDLLGARATELDLTIGAPAGVTSDPELHALACRRPVIEWALRRRLAREDRVRTFAGARVESLVANPGDRRVRGARLTDGGVITADLLIDATGRNSRLAAWLAALGAPQPVEETSPCGLVYYCRYYRFLGGGTLPTTMHPLGPRADLGYMSFGAFNGDGGTWAITLNCPAWDRSFHVLRDEATFERVVREIPAMAPLVAEDVSVPITPVLPMGELRNVRRSLVSGDRLGTLGLVAIGDVLANTNPAYAWGLSLGLANAVEIADAIDEHRSDVEAIALAFEATAAPRADSCFRWSRDTDLARGRAWSGQPVDDTSPDGDLPLFLMSTLVIAGSRDPEIYVRSMRRAQLLDPLDELASDRTTLQRAATIASAARKAHAPARQGPSRDEMRRILAEGASAMPSG